MTPRLPEIGADALGLGEAERLASAYAPAELRRAYRAILALDTVLRRLALSAREPLPAQLGLAWWRDACGALPQAQGHPVLRALAASWPVGPDALVALVDAWEEVAVADGGFARAAEAVAEERAGVLSISAREAQDATRDAARVWTLATLADHAPGGADRTAMRAAAWEIAPRRLPRMLRPLAVLEGLARRALAADRGALIGDRWSPLAAMRLGIFGR